MFSQLPQDISSKKKTSSSGVSPAKCIFCDKGRKRIKRKVAYPRKRKQYDTEISIGDAATILDDENIQLNVSNCEFWEGLNFIILEVHYNHKCKREKNNLLKYKVKQRRWQLMR